MSSLLVQNALANVWCVPDPFNQVILQPNRITPINGVSTMYSYMWSQIYLPNTTSVFHLYEIGQINPNLIDLFSATQSWQLIATASNTSNVVIDLYTALGIQLPRTRTWFQLTKNGSILLAVEYNPAFPYDFNNDAIYMRLYKNAYFEQSGLSNNEAIVVGGGLMTSLTMITALTTQINAIVNSSYYTGGMVLMINGYKQPSITIATVTIGDVAEFVYDSTIYKVADFQITNLTSFNSVLDNVNKVLLHYAENSDGFIDYIDNIDIFMIDVTTQKGVYVHKNASNTLRMVTYKDYAFVTNYLTPYFVNFPTTNQANLYLRLHIRYAGTEHTPLLDSNLTGYLYKLPDTQLVQAMVGSLSTVPMWQASALENSAYTTLMRSNYNAITLPLVEKAYGYTEANYTLGQTPIGIPPGSSTVTIPPAFQLGSTAFEYDGNGILLGYYNLTSNTLIYSINNIGCATVEFVAGTGSVTLDEYYDLVPTVLTPGNNYRFYIYVPDLATNTTTWVDVTNSTDYSITTGIANWCPTAPSGVLKRLVRSDKRFLLYQTTLNPIDGLLVHQLTYTQNTLSGQLQAALSIPLGELDVWLNGHSLVAGIDYIFQFPTISIISKEYLTTTPGPQTLTIRFTGFCNSALQPTPLNEVGYVYNGVLSANGAYNLHANRVQRIVVGGSLVTVNKVSFIETTTSGSLTDGLPYSIRDIINPLNNLIDVDPYAYYATSKAIETTVSNYLSVALPQITGSPINPITNKYVLYSPFIGKIIYDLTQGYIVNAQLSGPYADALVMKLCLPYLYLLAFDPITPINQPDARYCVIQPHWLTTAIALGTNNYRFILNVIRIYGNGLVNSGSLITLNPAL